MRQVLKWSLIIVFQVWTRLEECFPPGDLAQSEIITDLVGSRSFQGMLLNILRRNYATHAVLKDAAPGVHDCRQVASFCRISGRVNPGLIQVLANLRHDIRMFRGKIGSLAEIIGKVIQSDWTVESFP